jgi:hypothetical protein
MNPVSGVLGEAWELYRRHAAHFLVISFLIYVIIAVITALLTALLYTSGGFLGSLLTVIGMFLLQAALVKAVQDVRDGRVDLSVKETLRAAVPDIGAVALASVLASVAIWIGFTLFIIPGLILVTFLSLIVPCIVIGRSGALGSFGRSWKTVSGHGWAVFGTYAMTFLLLIAAPIVLYTLLSFLPHEVASFLAEVVSGTLVAPFIACVVTQVYYRLTAVRGEAAEPPAPASP